MQCRVLFRAHQMIASSFSELDKRGVCSVTISLLRHNLDVCHTEVVRYKACPLWVCHGTLHPQELRFCPHEDLYSPFALLFFSMRTNQHCNIVDEDMGEPSIVIGPVVVRVSTLEGSNSSKNNLKPMMCTLVVCELKVPRWTPCSALAAVCEP